MGSWSKQEALSKYRVTLLTISDISVVKYKKNAIWN